MSAAQIDTSGEVRVLEDDTGGAKTFALYRWRNLSPFAQGYVSAALEALDAVRMAEYRAAEGRSVPVRLGYSYLAPETLAAMLKDCDAIAAKRLDNFQPAEDAYNSGSVAWQDRQSGDLLSIYGEFPPVSLILGEDGKVRHDH